MDRLGFDPGLGMFPPRVSGHLNVQSNISTDTQSLQFKTKAATDVWCLRQMMQYHGQQDSITIVWKRLMKVEHYTQP